MIFITLVCLFNAAHVLGDGLKDNNGIVGTAVQDLSSSGGFSWSVSNGTTVVKGNVPGDLITDLELGGVIGDPLYMLNFKVPVWDMGNWTYTLAFTPSADVGATANQMIVFEGLKMVA